MPCHVYLVFLRKHRASQKNDLANFCDKNTLCGALVCKDAMFVFCDLSNYLFAPATNYLQKYYDTQERKPRTAFHQEGENDEIIRIFEPPSDCI